MKFFVSMVLAGALSIGAVSAADFGIDPAHSRISFNITHLSVSNVEGNFSKFDGTLDIDTAKNEIKKMDGEIDIASIDTQNQQRDSHLKAGDFFDATSFPKGKFHLVSFKKLDGNNIEIKAEITLKGITKQATFKGTLNGPIEHPKTKKQVYGLKINGQINRKDFKIGQTYANVMLSENVDVTIALEVNAK